MHGVTMKINFKLFYVINMLQRVKPCHKIFKHLIYHSISTRTFCINVILLSVFCELSLSYHWPITEHLTTLLCWIYSVIFSACTLPNSIKDPCKHYAKYFCNSTQILIYNVSFILHKYRCIIFLIWMLSVLYNVLATIYYDSVKEINHGGVFTLFFFFRLVSRKCLK
jgi:hypothetical protein